MKSDAAVRNVPYPADLMFQIVADVERYPEFLPSVKSLRVLARETDGDRVILLARMTVGYGAFHESYTSRVTLDPRACAIDVVQTEGPFRILENHWRFVPNDTGCEVDFSIAFAFKSKILQAVAGAAFERVMLKMAEAFEERARALHDQVATR